MLTHAYMLQVQRGETMWGISKRYGIEIDDICRLNPGVDPDRVYAVRARPGCPGGARPGC